MKNCNVDSRWSGWDTDRESEETVVINSTLGKFVFSCMQINTLFLYLWPSPWRKTSQLAISVQGLNFSHFGIISLCSIKFFFLATCNSCLSLLFVYLWEESHSQLNDPSWVAGDSSHLLSLLFSKLKRCSGPSHSSQQPTLHPSTHHSILPLQPLQFLRVFAVTEGS